MFKKFFRKFAGVKDFFTNETMYLEYNDYMNDYGPIGAFNRDVTVKEMSYIFINESEKLIKIFMKAEVEKLQRELGSSHGKKRVFETDAFLHPTELLRILHKGSVDGNVAYIVECEGRNDDKVIVQGKNLIHMYEWDSEIDKHRRVRQFIGSNSPF